MKKSISRGSIFLLPYFMVLFFLFTFSLANIYGQEDVQVSENYLIKLKDGGTITGKILSINNESIKLETAAMGTVSVSRINISEMILLDSQDSLKGWFPNPNPSKYLLGNSAIPLEKGSGYYQNTWVFFNAFNYAFTDFFSITAGFEIFSLLAAGEGPFAYYLNPKVSFEVADNVYLGGNVLYANTIRTTDDFGGLGTLNAFGTYGNANNNITAGVGWGFVEGEFSSKPVVTVSGMLRVSRRLAFISENWIVPIDGYYGVFSYGVRFLGEKTAIDLAFINNPDIAKGLIIGIPMLDFVVKF